MAYCFYPHRRHKEIDCELTRLSFGEIQWLYLVEGISYF